MSKIKLKTSTYRIVAEARGHEVVYYFTFGSYSGEWLMVSRDKKNYYFWKECYGSCSVCDALEAEFGFNDVFVDDKRVVQFIKNYFPFAVVPRNNIKAILTKSGINKIIHNKLIDKYSDIDIKQARKDILILLRLWEGVARANELLDLRDLEIRREAIQRYGEEKFASELRGEILDKDDKDNFLIKIVRPDYQEPFVFLNLKDTSTDRRYLLRVPPNTKTVLGGIAWSFGLKEEEYRPEEEA